MCPWSLSISQRICFNEAAISRYFMIPGLITLIMTLIGILLTALVIAREWERGTMEAMLVTPLRKIDILLGKTLPYYFLGMFGMVMSVVVGTTLVGIGLLVSSLSTTMQQGLLGAFLFLMPAITLSGLATPVENMPMWLQQADMFNPVRHIITALRRIFLEGADLAMVWPQIWPLLIMACVTLPLAAWLFRRRSV